MAAGVIGVGRRCESVGVTGGWSGQVEAAHVDQSGDVGRGDDPHDVTGVDDERTVAGFRCQPLQQRGERLVRCRGGHLVQLSGSSPMTAADRPATLPECFSAPHGSGRMRWHCELSVTRRL